jgi:uncharacterized protein
LASLADEPRPPIVPCEAFGLTKPWFLLLNAAQARVFFRAGFARDHGAAAMRAIAVRLWAALALAFVCLAGLPLTPASAEGVEKLELRTGSGAHAFDVEIAKDDASRARGLMDRRYMAPNHGMLFEFDSDDPVTFWMKDTYIPLDMVFITRAGVVARVVANAEPLSENVIPSGVPVAAVLELNGGTAAAIGVKPGDKVRHPFFRP